jgi:uncharacterized protein (TIGR02300 family)
MAKAEWGSKRTCPKCGTRFYDLGKEDPVVCIECENAWTPEPVLKSKQTMPYDANQKDKEAKAKEEKEDEVADDDLDIDVDEDDDSPDNDVDLGGDDDLGVVKGKGDDDKEDT